MKGQARTFGIITFYWTFIYYLPMGKCQRNKGRAQSSTRHFLRGYILVYSSQFFSSLFVKVFALIRQTSSAIKKEKKTLSWFILASFCKKKNLCCFLGNLFDIDLKSVSESPVSSLVKKRPDKSLIKQKVALVVRKWRNGLKLKCKLKVWREEVEASAEDEVKDAEPPIEGRCKSPSNPWVKVNIFIVFPIHFL